MYFPDYNETLDLGNGTNGTTPVLQDFVECPKGQEVDYETNTCAGCPAASFLIMMGGACLPCPAGEHGHGERSRSQLHFKLAGTGTMLILGWLFKFGC